MHALRAIGVTVVSFLLWAPAAMAQPGEPTVYSFVADWHVPRAQWATFTSDFDKNTRPVLEKLAAAGTLVGWGAYENIVHTEQAPTHGVWWSSATMAGIERARGELVAAAAASTSITSAAGHRDYLLRSLVGNMKSGSGTGGYLSVSSYVVKPMQGREWRQLWDQNMKPILDDMVVNGALVGYMLEVEAIHTADPGLRLLVTLAPDAESLDKVDAAFDAAFAKRSEDERRKLNEASNATLDPGSHRDSHMRVIRYWMK